MGKLPKAIGIIAGVSLLLAGATWRSVAAGSPLPPGSDSDLEQKVIQYIRERFRINATVRITAQPLRPFSAYPAFEEMPITFDDGKQLQTMPFFLTKDRHYLIVGGLYPVRSNVVSEIVQHAREQYKLPVTTKLVAGPLHNSPYPDFLASTVMADDGKQKKSLEIYVSRDNRVLLLGNFFSLVEHPRQEVMRTISLRDQPTQGPAHAPVTIVEYADLQCPSCAILHGFLEKEVLPKYEGKVRLVFKEFPLVAVHDWSLTGAIANECVYAINPVAFVPFRSLVFQSQGTLNSTNVRDLLLNYAEQAGVDRVRLAGCLDAKASLPRVEQDLVEGQRLDVQQTPTCFINGKMIVGMRTAAEFFKEIDDALAGK